MKFFGKFSLWFIIVVFILALSSVTIYSAVEINGFVNDYANVISPQYQGELQGILQKLYDTKTAEFSIVTIDSLEGQDIESYALNLAQGKLGDKEKNNGLLLLVAIKERKYRFEVGRGIEPILNDAKIGRIGRTYLIENFRNEDYGKGIYESSLAVSSILLGETDSEYYVTALPQTRRNTSGVFISLFFLFILISSISGSSGIKNHKYRKRDRFFNAAIMAGLLFGGGGRGGSGGGMGGFGGFGGGGFGGGGASGGW